MGIIANLKSAFAKTPDQTIPKTGAIAGNAQNAKATPLTGPGGATALANAKAALPASRPAAVPGQTELPLTGQLTPTVPYTAPYNKTLETSHLLYAVGSSHAHGQGNPFDRNH